ncbi:hypothetical protein BVX97_05935 [bacterium E08(2017)]|nr:hypothetical protein BVX97_05935 [bacterium E08(2017)]
MNIKDMASNWDSLAAEDSMYVILTDPDKSNNQWDKEEFFASGVNRIESKMAQIEKLHAFDKKERALDFGCGLGRLTNPLAGHFSRVDGVDVSEEMIEQARGYCKYPERVKYFHNPKTDLSLLDSNAYDFVYSEIVLQHVPPKHQISYVKEFVRLMQPGGVMFLQTIHAIGWRALVPNWFAEICWQIKYGGRSYIPMYGIPCNAILRLCKSSGLEVLNHESYSPQVSAQRFTCDEYILKKT